MILVTGGAGFIGSHVCKLLEKRGVDFGVIDNLERGHRAALRECKFFQIDLRNREDVIAVFAKNNIEAVLHFAAYIEVGESVADPAKFYQNNVLGTWNVLEAMRQIGTSNIVFSSTAAVYGEPETDVIEESHRKSPTSPYGETKWAVEQMIRSYEKPYGIRSVCLRYFNACGADPESELGEDHRPETHLIPRILKCLQGHGEFSIYGTDYDTEDGTCIRDYIHVDDLAQAHILALDHLQKSGDSMALNLGSGIGNSVLEVVSACEEVTGRNIRPQILPRRPGDPARLVASAGLAKQVLRWEPRFNELRSMISHSWNWYTKNPNGYLD